jgi:hypothetical protein
LNLSNFIKRKAMNTQTEARQLHQSIDEISDPKMLHLLNDLVGYIKSTQRISVEQYNKELEESEAEFDRGEFFTQAEVKKIVAKWK